MRPHRGRCVSQEDFATGTAEQDLRDAPPFAESVIDTVRGRPAGKEGDSAEDDGCGQ
jgi:hypothetical protein